MAMRSMARAHDHANTSSRSQLSYCTCILLLCILTGRDPAVVKADGTSLPSSLTLYFITQPTPVILLPPPVNGVQPPGATAVFSNVANESPDPNSPVIAQVLGQFGITTGEFQYLSYSTVLNTTSYTGTIEAQGVVDPLGNGELAITGGTGDFRKASGYLTNQANVENVLLKTTFFISYDCKC